MNSTKETFFHYPQRIPNLHEWPLLDSSWPVTIICAVYLLFVLKFGRIFMENRKPYELKKAMIIYNIFQVIYNVFMFSIALKYIVLERLYDFRCMNHQDITHPKKFTESWATYLFFINKICDLMDTVFFVLRKSYKQITFLHVSHHFIMVYVVYWVIQFYGFGGQYVTMGFLNSFVHSVMYAYYCVSAMYPQLKGNLWWKKHITNLQLIQFFILLCQSLYVLILNPTCPFPLPLQYLQIAMSLLMTTLFSNFYYHSYIKPKKPKSKTLKTDTGKELKQQ